MYESRKTAQMRLSTIHPTTRQLAEWERPSDRPAPTPKRFAKKRRMERKHVRDKLPERPLIQTLMGAMERNYIIRAVDKW